jgi:signal transduction histidine kinase/CheY-like chemotaxis protein
VWTATCAAQALLAVTVPTAAWAQPAAPRLEDDAYVVFGRRDGIPDTPLLSLQPATGGRLLLGTAEGATMFDGRQWMPLATPPAIARSAFRAIFDRANGERVFVTSRGVHTERNGRFSPPAELPASSFPVYSAVAVPRQDGGDDVVVGAKGGVFELDASGHMQRVPLPEQMLPLDAMVAARRDGTASELWVGTRGGGVARRRDGVWTRWDTTHGLTNMSIDQVSLAPSGDTLTALAATHGGAFALHRNRWVRIGPPLFVTRVLRVAVGSHFETWLGTFSGELYRSRDDRTWQLVDITARIRGSRTQVLTAVDHGLGHPTIYAAFRSGNLLRFRIGLAGRVIVPSTMIGHPTMALSNTLRNGSFWMWLQGIGAVRLPAMQLIPSSAAILGGGDGRVRMLTHRTATQHAVFIAIEGRLYRQQGDGWQRFFDWGSQDYVHGLASAFGPDRRPGVIALSNAGATIVYDNGTVAPWRGFPIGARAAVVDSTHSPHTLIVVTYDRRVMRFNGAEWAPVPGGPVPIVGNVGAASMVRLRSGECALQVGTSEGLASLRTCGGAPQWRIVRDSVVPALRHNEVTALAVLASDALAVGTTQGVTFLQFDSTFARGVRAAYSVTDADGLPHASVMSLGPLDSAGRLWVGTTLGLGFVNTDQVERTRAPLRITSLDVRDGRGERMPDGARVPEGSARLDISITAPSHHREDETTFRVELDGVPVHPAAWTDQASVSLVGVAAGRHTLRVRARDYDGRESLALVRQFTVQRPWWRSWTAALVYLVLLTTGVFAWGRTRTRAARQRALEAEENERRIAVSEARFRHLFEDGTNPQVLVLDGSIWQLNGAAEALVGAKQTQLQSRPIDTLVPGIGAHLASSAALGRWELEAMGAHGAIPVEVRRTRIPLDGAVLDHLELADLRERNQLEAERSELEAQLREAQRLESVGTLAGGVAHDFNNLLTVIHTNAELAASDVPVSSPAADSLQQLLVASRRAREVVRQILTFSRHTRSVRASVHIDALLIETQSLLRAMIPSTVRVEFVNEAPGAVVEGDATQLQQLLLNLCSNAEYAMRSTNGGVLTVGARWEGEPNDGTNSVRLSVSDTGPGIPADVRTRMFEPFFTTKPVGEGTGLGLSVLHGIVGEHGGIISVLSEPGRGATFDVVLPAHRVGESNAAPPVAVAAAASTARRVLLVDDEAAIVGAVRRLLQRQGYVVDVASNGAMALERMRARADIDLVITDQTMPVMTGIEFIERVRADGVRTPIILVSGFGAVAAFARVEELPDVWCMDKPFASDELLALVARALARG